MPTVRAELVDGADSTAPQTGCGKTIICCRILATQPRFLDNLTKSLYSYLDQSCWNLQGNPVHQACLKPFP